MSEKAVENFTNADKDVDEFLHSYVGLKLNFDGILAKNEALEETIKNFTEKLNAAEYANLNNKNDRDKLQNTVEELKNDKLKLQSLSEEKVSLEKTLDSLIRNDMMQRKKFEEEKSTWNSKYKDDADSLRNNLEMAKKSVDNLSFENSLLKRRLNEKDNELKEINEKLRISERQFNQQNDKFKLDYETKLLVLQTHLSRTERDNQREIAKLKNEYETKFALFQKRAIQQQQQTTTFSKAENVDNGITSVEKVSENSAPEKSVSEMRLLEMQLLQTPVNKNGENVPVENPALKKRRVLFKY